MGWRSLAPSVYRQSQASDGRCDWLDGRVAALVLGWMSLYTVE